MKDIVFREYDIRGKVAEELIIDDVYDVVRAIAFYFLSRNSKTKTIAVGMDGRTHSPAIKKEVCRALQESGLDVVFIGLCPSPALYFALHTMPVDGGLMITASHNPKEYNGIKICHGTSVLWGEQIQDIKTLFHDHAHVEPTMNGRYQEISIIEPYVSWLAHHFHHLQGSSIAAVIDCGNGAAGAVMPRLAEVMEWSQVQLLYADVDGTYPNHEADPTVLANMQDVKQLLSTTSATIGIGIDGDADRMAPMTKNGYLVPGDQLLALFAQQVAQENLGATVVFDVKASQSIIDRINELQLTPHMSPSGHAIIKKEMRKTRALLAGELSCHFFFADRYFGYDDAIYAMMRLFEIITTTGKTLEELLADFPPVFSTKEFRVPYDPAQKDALIAAAKRAFAARKDAHVVTIDGVRATMPYGWGLVRPSNTQAVVSLRFESQTKEGLERIKEDFAKVLMPFLGERALEDTLVHG